MKRNILQRTAVFCIGAVFALSAVSARAEEPKKDGDTKTTHRKVVKQARPATKVVAKRGDDGKPIPTRDGANSQYQPGRSVGGSQGEEYSVLTGSHIPRRYHRNGYNTTDTYDNHFIYDQNDIRIQSARSPAEALRSVPGLSVRGGR